MSFRARIHGRRIDSTATLTLGDPESGQLLRQVRRSTLEFDDDSWQPFPFESITDSVGKAYRFTLETDAEQFGIELCPGPAGEAIDVRAHSFPDLANLLDPLLSQSGQPLPAVPDHLERYMDRHIYQCIKLRRYFFPRLVHLADAVGRVPGSVIDALAIGAGVAYQEAFLAGRFPSMRLLATDVEPQVVDFPMPNLRFERLDALEPPRPERFDLVFSIECLEHVQDYRTAFRHMATMVRPGGYLYISVPFASRAEQDDPELRRQAWEECEHYRPGFSFEDLEELFAENGLEVVHAANMFHLDVMLPLRRLVDVITPAELEFGIEDIARLYLLDVKQERVTSCREAEGIRFLGRRPIAEVPPYAAVADDLAAGTYAFLDAGCGSGGSLRHCAPRFGRSPGLGLDWYGQDLMVALHAGLSVAFGDITREELPDRCVDYVSMMDFLEHLPDEATAVQVLGRFARASRDFLFIRHPSFDDVDYLAQLGLKLTWTDWTGHPNMMTTDDLRRIFAAQGWDDYVIIPNMPIGDSRHPAIVPISAPVDSQSYDSSLHGPKPHVQFDRPIFGKFDIFVRLNPNLDPDAWRRIASVRGWEAIWV